MNYLGEAARNDASVTVANDSDQDEFSFRDIIRALWRRRRILLISVALAVIGTAAYLIVTPVRYMATTTLILDAKRPSLGASEVFIEPQVDDTAVESHVETIRSESVAILVVKKLRLFEDPEFVGVVNALENSIDGKTETPPTDEGVLREAVSAFSRGLSVNRLRRSYVVEISFTSADRNKAARIANATADAYIEDQLQAKFDVTKRASHWLQQRIVELRDQATSAYKAIQDFKSRNNLIVGRDGKLSSDLELEQLTGSLAQARADTTRAQSRLSEIEAILAVRGDESGVPENGTVSDALSNPVITKLRQDYLDRKKQEAEWGSRYGPNHQAVINLRTEMAGLKRAIREEMQRIAETYKSDLKVAQAKEESTARRITEVFQNDSATRQSQVKLQELETAASTFRSIYENFLNRYTQAVQQQSFPSTEARVITYASPGRKTSPKILMSLGVALAAGLGLGTIGVFVREQLDRVVYSRDQIARELGADLICTIRRIGEQNEPKTLSSFVSRLKSISQLKSKMDELRRGGAEDTEETHLRPPVMLYDAEDLLSIDAEAVRGIKVAIDIRNISQSTRVVAIVSATKGEGKSSVALSLSAMVAQAGRRALLIDADLRRPSLSAELGSKNDASLLEILYGESAIADVIRTDEHYGYDFLCGPTKIRPVHTADILNSEPMSKLLVAAKRDYDYVIVDLPPILPVVDTRACSHLFDAFIVVAEWGKTNVDDLAQSFELAPLVRDRLIGVVLNKVDVDTMRRIEGYGYVRSAYYG
ncbi:AAA family ATPase [Methylosinus sp. Ce-a6]|uniref:AAA family ATPase n=1 Tax=Methylosinus sp. Ce-a6 TaxID=2172005 RepID=UPI00135AAD80|nr:AAA family ATPase [Methylosinus sp. Ce-a6]